MQSSVRVKSYENGGKPQNVLQNFSYETFFSQSIVLPQSEKYQNEANVKFLLHTLWYWVVDIFKAYTSETVKQYEIHISENISLFHTSGDASNPLS